MPIETHSQCAGSIQAEDLYDDASSIFVSRQNDDESIGSKNAVLLYGLLGTTLSKSLPSSYVLDRCLSYIESFFYTHVSKIQYIMCCSKHTHNIYIYGHSFSNWRYSDSAAIAGTVPNTSLLCFMSPNIELYLCRYIYIYTPTPFSLQSKVEHGETSKQNMKRMRDSSALTNVEMSNLLSWPSPICHG